MESLNLHEFHETLGARFVEVNGAEAVRDYGDVMKEHAAITSAAIFSDLSFRSRICLTGSDRVRFLHGQATNDIRRLGVGEGCYAALVTAKGRMQSDLNVYCLADELLLDLEPGLTQKISERLLKYIVADDVQVIDVGAHYGMLTVQGPNACTVMRNLGWFKDLPAKPFNVSHTTDPGLGELYLVHQPRLGTEGFDLFVPVSKARDAAAGLLAAIQSVAGRPCGWEAFETARILAGIPRFGQDMDEGNFPQECGIEKRAVSYTKGCYIGQEVLNRIHTMGHVNHELFALTLPDDAKPLPRKGDKLFQEEREIGALTSTTIDPGTNQRFALGYLRSQMVKAGVELKVAINEGECVAKVFRKIEMS